MLYWTLKTTLTPVLRLGFRLRVEGRDRVPRHVPVILAANHRSFLDSLFLPLAIGWRRMTFVAKAEYFEQRRTAWFFRAVGQIPIQRSGGEASDAALNAATSVLRRGEAFGIYPEGTRTRDGLTHRGHTGVARLALATGASIVPVGLVGTDEAQPTDAKLPRLLRPVGIRFGAPIRPDRYRDDPEGLALRGLTDEVMFEIVQLCGVYEYQDTYATKRAEDLPTPTARITALPTARVA
jgi:1-acyl-sn-glycerol-3-phosphate acyltransferase